MTVTSERAAVSSTRETMTMPIGEFLLRRLKETGVRQAFGVPGGFNLELLQQLEDSGSWSGSGRVTS